jgi:hypothetical protein
MYVGSGYQPSFTCVLIFTTTEICIRKCLFLKKVSDFVDLGSKNVQVILDLFGSDLHKFIFTHLINLCMFCSYMV